MLFISLINIFPLFGSHLADDPQPKKKEIQVKFHNLVIGEELATLVNNDPEFLQENLRLKEIKKLPYILKNSARSKDKYIFAIEVVATLIFHSGKNLTFLYPMQEDFDEPVVFLFPLGDKKYVDRIMVQIHGKSFNSLKLKENKLNFIGDHDPITLGSIWHPIQTDTTGWLYEDSLNVYFQQTPSKDHPYGLTFGKKTSLEKNI